LTIESKPRKTFNPTTKYDQIQSRVHHLLESHYSDDKAGKVIAITIGILILLNLFAAMFETVSEIPQQYRTYLLSFEGVSAIIFTIEYIFRLWSCNWRDSKFHSKPLVGRLLYMIQPLSIIDLIAILPFYLPMIVGFELTFIRVFRLFRFMRLFKFGRYSESLENIGKVFQNSKPALMVSLFIGIVFWISISTIVYHFENEVQPEAFRSIPETMWWLILSFTSFGDATNPPLTIMGQLLSVVTGFIGMSLLALPTGILGAAFVEELDHHHSTTNKEQLVEDKI
jgi:voltage-gated potassium channel